jgi:nucleoside-diphosphate-sugar epimerase
MRIMVTGHKGYIGVVLVSMLLERGYEVVGLDSDLFRRCDYTAAPVEVPEILKDIREVSAADLEGVDAVMHLAALSNDPLGNLNPNLTKEINFEASYRLAKLCRERGVERFIFSSSCSNYGAAGEGWMTEESPVNPVTAYGQSKVMVEQAVSKLANDNFSPTFLRNATAYGHSCRIRFDLVLNNLVAWAMTTKRIHIKSDGTPWRPVVHIADISRAFIAAVEVDRARVHNQSLNIGRNDQNYQVRQIADLVKAGIPDAQVDYAADGEPDKRSYRVDFSKVNSVLPEFKAEWTVARGVEELKRVMAEHQIVVEEIEGERYQRVAHIRSLIGAGVLDETLRTIPL